jgi:hypothetical protein
MSRFPARRPLAGLALAAVASVVLTSPAFAGPPWISVELPVNPYGEGTRGALCLIHVYHHGDIAYYPITGTAEGLVNGQRQSAKVDIRETSMPGVYAVRYQAPAQGTWMLAVSIGKGKDMGEATALITLNGGEVSGVRVPTKTERGYLMPAAVPAAAIDSILRTQVALAAPAAFSPRPAALWVLGSVALMVGLAGLRRRDGAR